MILTNCAACAAPLAHNAPRCVRCHTRYCNKTCQHDHWRRGHKQICKKIHRAGGAEQYYADKKYKEAVAVAVEACADDTKGQTCYICMEALRRRTGEGLVRGCACGDRDGVASGSTGVVHVSCLAEQAKILVEEALEDNLFDKAEERFQRWNSCSLCEQEYHSVVACALGWACWKTYLARPHLDPLRHFAKCHLANGLRVANFPAEALAIFETLLATDRRLGSPEQSTDILQTRENIACCYQNLGRDDDALTIRREVFAAREASDPNSIVTFRAALNLVRSLYGADAFKEAARMGSKMVPAAQRALGIDHEYTMVLCWNYATCRLDDPSASLEDLIQGEALLSDTYSRFRRVMGDLHPDTPIIRRHLENARVKVAHARLLATGEATTSFEPVPGLDLEHVVIHGFPPGSAEATCCFLVFWSCAAVALAWLVFFYKY